MGEFRIVGRLGQGGQGIVYLAESPGAGQAAVKVMTGGIDRTFARELAAARKVDEFCTARVIVADLDHDPPYVAAEYIDGPALATAGPLSGSALTRLALGTVTALAAIHRAGVVHRDFKPGNVLLGPDGPRVIDFGIARLADATSTRGSSSGTPPYMAPEQLSGQPVGPACDMFAWGSTMTFAGTGAPPFGRDTFAAVAYRILHEEPDLGGLPEPLRGIVARCLAKDPARRPSARTVLLELLGEPDTAPEPGMDLRPAAGPGAASGDGDVAVLSRGAVAAAGVRPEPGRVSRRAVLLGAGAVVSAAAVTGGVLWWRLPRGGPSQTAGSATLGVSGTRGVTGTPGVSGTPSVSSTPGVIPSGAPEVTGTSTEAVEAPVSAPPARGMSLAIAMQGAIAVAPLADLTFEGGLTQSSFHGTGRGRVRYDADGSYSVGSCDFAVRMASDEGTLNITVLNTGGTRDTYLNGHRTWKDPDGAKQAYIDMLVVMAGIGVILELVGQAGQVNRSGRRYSGGLEAGGLPTAIKERLGDMSGGGAERLKGTRVTWRLELDKRNRPMSFELAWWVAIEGTELSSTFTTTFRNWRDEQITRPG
ncbi:serine/threonine-protein kinase [Nonomuraea zeae]|uniref:serine/threonine-protein kinase n=1 Tax=Nonomuraea zeae TaxID=1642303 RepID=UPI0014783613|nr:serine/threonine-protein kinase [Nonomuraea zeae]